MGLKTVIKNAVFTDCNGSRAGDLFIDGSVISAPFSDPHRVIDARGLHIFPGFADVHVHFREPGFSYKETIASGSAAAAAGGYTDVCTMPNLDPVPDCPEAMAVQQDIIRRDAVIRVHPYASITKGEKGEELVPMEALCRSAVAFSDDGRGIQNAGVMLEAMERASALGKIIAAHCEDNSLINNGCINQGEYSRIHGLPGIPAKSEWGPIERDIELCRRTGAAYHICHVSKKESLEAVRRAKEEGLDVTCESAPHYIAFCDGDMEDDGRFKMNPPLGSAMDREALINAIADGTVDMIATDHAPHSLQEKSMGLKGSLMGVVGLETAFPAVYTYLVKTGRISLYRAVELFSLAPRRRFGVGGSLEEGHSADFTLYDLEESYTVDPESFLTCGRATPFAGKKLYGRCAATFMEGRPVWRRRGFEAREEKTHEKQYS